MDTFLTYTALVLVIGSIYAIAASGLVLTYNTSGIFNFAHGAMAMLGAFTIYQVNVEWGVPMGLSLLLVLGVLGPSMGWLLHRFVMRGLTDTEPVTRIVVTVAVLLGMVAFAQWMWDPTTARIPPVIFGASSTVEIAGITLKYHDVLCLVIAVALAIGLRILFTQTRLGVLMRGAVDDPDLLRLTGHDPDRAAALSWIMGSTLAVLAGVLITPVIGGPLEAHALTLLVVQAFAAAVFGKLQNIPMTFIGAIVLGLAGTYLVGYAPTEWSFAANLQQSLPMFMLFGVLLFLKDDRLTGTVQRARERYEVPSTGRAAVWGVVFVVAVFAFSRIIDAASIGILLTGISFAIIALSITLLTGYAGELNLAPLAFCAVATLVTYHVGLAGPADDLRISLVGVLLGVLCAGLVGVLVALPAMRLRGLYLALATLAFGVIVSNMLLRDTTEHTILGHTFTIFPQGNILVPPLQVGPLDLANENVFLVTVSVVFAALGTLVIALRNSSYGRRLAAMKDSPAASAMLGQRLLLLKVSAFALSTSIAGLGGILMAMATTSVAMENFNFLVSLSLVMLTVVGGIGYVSGALFGGLLSGAALNAIVAMLNDVSTTHPQHEKTLDLVAHLVLVGVAFAGIGVAKNPSGALRDVFVGHRMLARAPEVRYAAVAVQVALYALAYADVIGTTLFVVLSLMLWMFLPLAGLALRREKILGAAAPRPEPIELAGLHGGYGEQLRTDLERRIGISVPAHALTPSTTPSETKETVDVTA